MNMPTGWLCVELCDRIIMFFWRDWLMSIGGSRISPNNCIHYPKLSHLAPACCGALPFKYLVGWLEVLLWWVPWLCRFAAWPCSSSSVCTRKTSYGTTLRSLPWTTCSCWSIPTPPLCSSAPTKTRVGTIFVFVSFGLQRWQNNQLRMLIVALSWGVRINWFI